MASITGELAAMEMKGKGRLVIDTYKSGVNFL